MKRPPRAAKTTAADQMKKIVEANRKPTAVPNNEIYEDDHLLGEVENPELFARKGRRKRRSTVPKSRKIRKSKKKSQKKSGTPKKRTPKVPTKPKRASTIKQTVKDQKEIAKRGRKKKSTPSKKAE